MLPKKYRLRLKRDFDRIFKQGRFAGGKFFTLGYAKNDLDLSRFAVVVAKKVDKRAVRRNLIRRRTSEAIRLGQGKIKTGFDFVFIARPAVLGKTYQEIKEDIVRLFSKAKLI